MFIVSILARNGPVIANGTSADRKDPRAPSKSTNSSSRPKNQNVTESRGRRWNLRGTKKDPVGVWVRVLGDGLELMYRVPSNGPSHGSEIGPEEVNSRTSGTNKRYNDLVNKWSSIFVCRFTTTGSPSLVINIVVLIPDLTRLNGFIMVETPQSYVCRDTPVPVTHTFSEGVLRGPPVPGPSTSNTIR